MEGGGGERGPIATKKRLKRKKESGGGAETMTNGTLKGQPTLAIKRNRKEE